MNILDQLQLATEKQIRFRKRQLGQSFAFPSEYKSKLEAIKHLTSRDGRERMLSIYSVFGELFITEYTIGSDQAVRSKEAIAAKMQSINQKRVKLIITAQGKSYTKFIDTEKAMKMSKRIDLLVSYHTHPIHTEGEKQTWGFFSVTDLMTFITNNKLLATGLITKSYWLLLKTDNFTNLDYNMYNQIYTDLIHSGEHNFTRLISFLNQSGLLVYQSANGSTYNLRQA